MAPEAGKEYQRQLLTSLPADPHVSPFVKPAKVKVNDPRVGLRGSRGCRAHKGTRPILEDCRNGLPSCMCDTWQQKEQEGEH